MNSYQHLSTAQEAIINNQRWTTIPRRTAWYTYFEKIWATSQKGSKLPQIVRIHTEIAKKNVRFHTYLPKKILRFLTKAVYLHPKRD